MSTYFVIAREWVWRPAGLRVEEFDSVPDHRLKRAIEDWENGQLEEEPKPNSLPSFYVPVEQHRQVPPGANGLDFVTDQYCLVECESKRESQLICELLQRDHARGSVAKWRFGSAAAEQLSEVERIEAAADVSSSFDLVVVAREVLAHVRRVGGEDSKPGAARSELPLSWQDRVLGLLAGSGKDLTVRELADAVGVHPSTLYRNERVQKVLKQRPRKKPVRDASPWEPERLDALGEQREDGM